MMRKTCFFSILVLGGLFLTGLWASEAASARGAESASAGGPSVSGTVFAPVWPEYDTTALCRLAGEASNAAALKQNDCLREEAAARRRLWKLEWTSDDLIRSCDSVIRHLDGGSYRALEVCLMGLLHPEDVQEDESPPEAPSPAEGPVPPGSAPVQP